MKFDLRTFVIRVVGDGRCEWQYKTSYNGWSAQLPLDRSLVLISTSKHYDSMQLLQTRKKLAILSIHSSSSQQKFCNINLTIRGPCIAIIPIIKSNEMHYFSNLFWYRALHVSDRSTVHHQDFITVYTAIGICYTGYADCLLARSGRNILISLADSQHNLYNKYLLLCIQ